MKTLALGVACLAASILLAADTPPPPAAQKILGIFQELRDDEARPAANRRHVSFTLSDREINDYLRYSLKATPRPGLDSATLRFSAHNNVSTLVVVDFDAVERFKPGTIPTLLRPVLRGKQNLSLDVQFAVANSKLTFSVEKAYYDKLRLPAFFVEEAIKILAARQPEHYDTGKPLPLPFNLRMLSTEDHVAKGQSN